MRERIKKDGFTITPDVPSIELISKVYEFKFDKDTDPGFESGQPLIVQWVNRQNWTIGVRIPDDERTLLEKLGPDGHIDLGKADPEQVKNIVEETKERIKACGPHWDSDAEEK